MNIQFASLSSFYRLRRCSKFKQEKSRFLFCCCYSFAFVYPTKFFHSSVLTSTIHIKKVPGNPSNILHVLHSSQEIYIKNIHSFILFTHICNSSYEKTFHSIVFWIFMKANKKWWFSFFFLFPSLAPPTSTLYSAMETLQNQIKSTLKKTKTCRS